MVSLDTDTHQDVLFIMILVLNTIYSSINAIAQTSFLGNIGRFPAAYIGSANDGIGLGGILPAVISIIILGKETISESKTQNFSIQDQTPRPGWWGWWLCPARC